MLCTATLLEDILEQASSIRAAVCTPFAKSSCILLTAAERLPGAGTSVLGDSGIGCKVTFSLLQRVQVTAVGTMTLIGNYMHHMSFYQSFCCHRLAVHGAL